MLTLGIMTMTINAQTKVYPISDHFDGEKFHNVDRTLQPKSFLRLLEWWWEGGKKQWPTFVQNQSTPHIASSILPNEMVLTYVNHASMLIQLNQCNIITDPLFSNRASPVSFAGPKRVRNPGIAPC
jgi:hypothetical protein